MSVTLIQDLRWGDTGKGKISERLSRPDECDVSVRAVGGGNAGHVIQVGVRKMSLHLLPAGCVHEGVEVVLGQGMVTHLGTLLAEIDEVRNKFEVNPELRLIISGQNHLLFEGHKQADQALELRKGKDAVGTTHSGIGPAYADKALRVGMRMEDLLQSPDAIRDRYRTLLLHWAATYGVTLSSTDEQKDIAYLMNAKERLERCIEPDMQSYWRTRIEIAKRRVVIEGAQGSLLSIDAEGYPYVTSSPTTTNGHLQGAGIPARELSNVIGTLKAYDTRVGNGPMRTELSEKDAKRISLHGQEFGSTTGRPRRIGWLDALDAKARAWQESVTELAILKGDVLDGEKVIPVWTGMTSDGYSRLPVWSYPMKGLTKYEDLHPKAQTFHHAVSSVIGVPLRFIGTGPESDQLIEVPEGKRRYGLTSSPS